MLLLHDIEALEKQVSEETDDVKFEEVNTDLHNKRNELTFMRTKPRGPL